MKTSIVSFSLHNVLIASRPLGQSGCLPSCGALGPALHSESYAVMLYALIGSVAER